MEILEIKEICKKYGISQKELAEKIGMTQTSFNTILSKNQISAQTIAAIKLFIDNEELKQKIKEYEELKSVLKKALL